MAERQDQIASSSSMMTASCVSLICMNLMIPLLDHLWKRWFPKFGTLPMHIRRHDVNILMRAGTGPPLLAMWVYCAVKIFQDLDWLMDNRTFITYGVIVFLTIDLFDLSQRRKFFDWQPLVHHICQTFYILYLFEWSPNYTFCFPNLGLVIFSSGGRAASLPLFPLRRVASSGKNIVSYAKFAFWATVVAIFAGFATMVGLILKYQEHLSLASIIGQPIAFLLFQCLDLTFYKFLYKEGYPKSKTEKDTDLEKQELGEPNNLEKQGSDGSDETTKTEEDVDLEKQDSLHESENANDDLVVVEKCIDFGFAGR